MARRNKPDLVDQLERAERLDVRLLDQLVWVEPVQCGAEEGEQGRLVEGREVLHEM